MKRRPNFIALVFLAFFAFGVLCSTFAAPGQALASLGDCSQSAGPMSMVGCDHPTYLCGFDLASNVLSQGAVSSARSNDSVKNGLGLTSGVPVINPSTDLAHPRAREWTNISLIEPGKVSIRLFNSTLNL